MCPGLDVDTGDMCRGGGDWDNVGLKITGLQQ